MPVDKYAPTTHQKKFTSLIDIELAYENSRSFRRLYHAIEQLLAAAEKGERGYVSPLPEEAGYPRKAGQIAQDEH